MVRPLLRRFNMQRRANLLGDRLHASSAYRVVHPGGDLDLRLLLPLLQVLPEGPRDEGEIRFELLDRTTHWSQQVLALRLREIERVFGQLAFQLPQLVHSVIEALVGLGLENLAFVTQRETRHHLAVEMADRAAGALTHPEARHHVSPPRYG